MSIITAPTKMPRLTSRVKRRLSSMIHDAKSSKISYLFIAPFGVFFFTFTLLPVLLAMGLSFTHYNMLEAPQWIGLQNYLRLFFADDVFLIAVKNTFVFAVITGPVSYFLCLVFAWMINDLQPRLRALLTLLFYAPSISGNVYMIWTYLFSGDSYGVINGFLSYWGVIDKPIQFLTDPDWMMPIAILVTLWMSLGTSFLVFIAGLQGIDPTLYEAGAVDGVKNRFQEFMYLTLPALKPQLMFGAIMSITGSFAAASQIIPLVGFPSTDYAAHTVVAHLLDYGNIRFEMGYASAIAVILFLSMIITQQIVQRLLRGLDS